MKVDSGPVDPITPGNDPPTLPADGGVAYYDDDAGGPRVLIKGRDPNGDIAKYRLEFFNKDDAGNLTQASYDIDPDSDAGPQSWWEGPLSSPPNEAGFFVQLDQSRDFADMVNTLRVTVKDNSGNTSTPEITVTKRAAPVVSGACDPWGFTRCGVGQVCAKASSGSAYSCQPVTQARTTACNAAPTLSADSTRIWGSLRTTSLWDAPEPCFTGNPKNKPDGVVKVRLAAAAAKVIISTDNPGTNIVDTALYLLNSCTTNPSMCPDCTCADDISSSPSNRKTKLELTNVQANTDYFVVIEAFPTVETSGTDFEMTIEIQ